MDSALQKNAYGLSADHHKFSAMFSATIIINNFLYIIKDFM